MNGKTIGVYGASGFGREVLPIIRSSVPDETDVVFIDDNRGSDTLNGADVLSFDDFLNLPSSIKKVSVCIANHNIRHQLVEKLKENNIEQFSVQADNVVVLDEVSIGEGAVICPFVTLTSNIKIGVGFHANIYSYVAHDCIIGDYVTFAPGVKCNGNVVIEDYAYIGTGAILKQGTPQKPLVIGKGAVVGMGSVVTKSVSPGDTVFGSPAKSLKRRR